MGLAASISSLISKVFTKPKRIIMVGLDSVGKSSILYKLKLGEVIFTIPTIWDVGGGDKIRALWRHYFEGCHAMVFVFDSKDRARSGLAAEELHRLSREMAEHGGMSLLVFANKQDVDDAMSMEEIEGVLHPQDLKQNGIFNLAQLKREKDCMKA